MYLPEEVILRVNKIEETRFLWARNTAVFGSCGATTKATRSASTM